MSATLITSKQMTLEEYLEFDANAEGRYEYYDRKVFEMSDSSANHARLSARIVRLLGNQLDEKGCAIYSSDVRIKVPAMPPYRYADASAVYDEPDYEEIGNQELLINPTLIVEVLSPTTEKFDRDFKFKAYKSIESLLEYLLVSQKEKFVVLYTKHNEKFWFQSEYVAGESLILESLDCELSVDEIYHGII